VVICGAGLLVLPFSHFGIFHLQNTSNQSITALSCVVKNECSIQFERKLEKYAQMKKQLRRSDCPINFSLESFGDMWSLLIVRDIVYFGKKSYGEFLESDEGISTNILANRLAVLEQKGILVKRPHEADGRKEVYALTEKGLDIIPVLLEMANWGAHHDPDTAAPKEWIALVNSQKEKITRLIRTTVQEGGAIFVGPNSVLSKLAGAT
jgi:DNA-binding HxlR family transcriptional regulator